MTDQIAREAERGIEQMYGWLSGSEPVEPGYVEDVLPQNGLDYNVGLHPIVTRIYTGGKEIKKRLEDHRAVVREDSYEPLAVVGDRYKPVQHAEAFGLLDALVAKGALQIVRTRIHGQGQKVMLVSEAEGFKIAGEPIKRYQAWLNGHDGKTPVVMTPVPTRQFCTNVLRFNMRDENGRPITDAYKVKHTIHAPTRLLEAQGRVFGMQGTDDGRIEAGLEAQQKTAEALAREAEKAIAADAEYVQRIRELGNSLASSKMGDREFEMFLKALFPTDDATAPKTITLREEQRADVRAIYKSDDDLNDIRGTRWGALQSVVSYNDHYRPWRVEDSKVMSLVTGSKLNQSALKILSS